MDLEKIISMLFTPLVAIPAFLVLLTLIVFIHEYGHFSMARLLGVRIDVFSIGFGKTIARWIDKHGTEWRFALIPLGGFVKFFGDANAVSQSDPALVDPSGPATTQFGRKVETVEMTPEEKKVCFHFKPVWVRTLIVAAGPFSNFILAVAIFWVLLASFGAYVWQARIGAVEPNSAAAAAGFQPGDLIVAVDGRKIRDFNELSVRAKLGAGDRLTFIIERQGKEVMLSATPRREEMQDAFGNKVIVGKLGIAADPEARSFMKYNASEAFAEACGNVWGILSATVKFMGRLVLGKEDANQLGGPIKMAQLAGQAASSGFDLDSYAERPDLLTQLKVSLATFINLAAVVSVSIGFLNLLPVPVLDGGHLVYYAYEAIVGKPLGVKAQAIGFRVGIVLLASLMLFVTWNDITNLIAQAS
jgi:regulator of sigma E protease